MSPGTTGQRNRGFIKMNDENPSHAVELMETFLRDHSSIREPIRWQRANVSHYHGLHLVAFGPLVSLHFTTLTAGRPGADAEAAANVLRQAGFMSPCASAEWIARYPEVKLVRT